VRRGVLYVAAGERFVREAQFSAASVKRQHPDLHITLFTDETGVGDPFDAVQPIRPAPRTASEFWAARLRCLAQSPYAQTLALDADTYVCGAIVDLFDLADNFDLAYRPGGVHYYRHELPWLGDAMRPLPAYFPQPNAGVLLYRQSPAVEAFLRLWLEILLRNQQTAARAGCPFELDDQGAGREALFRSQLRVWALPTEYNCQFNFPGKLFSEVKILHGRHRDLPRVGRFMNRRPRPRLYLRLYGYVWLVMADGQIRALRTPPTSTVSAGPWRRLWLGLDSALYWQGLSGAARWLAETFTHGRVNR
jgi:hypothetical protein